MFREGDTSSVGKQNLWLFLHKTEKQNLMDNKIALCYEICENPNLLKLSGVSELRIKNQLDEGYQLCIN